MLARLQPARLNKLGETQTQSPKGGLGSLALHGISDQHPANRGMQSFNGVTLRTIKSYEQIKKYKNRFERQLSFFTLCEALGAGSLIYFAAAENLAARKEIWVSCSPVCGSVFAVAYPQCSILVDAMHGAWQAAKFKVKYMNME